MSIQMPQEELNISECKMREKQQQSMHPVVLSKLHSYSHTYQCLEYYF